MENMFTGKILNLAPPFRKTTQKAALREPKKELNLNVSRLIIQNIAVL